jgi:hypothetical protein
MISQYLRDIGITGRECISCKWVAGKLLTKNRRIRSQTLPQIQLLRAQFHQQNQLKLSSMVNASMVQAGASISEAAGTDGANYGNSVVSILQRPERG